MKAVTLLLCFAAAFGLAGLWQSRRLTRLEHERALAFRVQEGELGATPSGLLEAGTGVVVVGRPSGTEPIAAAPTPSVEEAPPVLPESEPPAPASVVEPQPLADFELAVQPGQTLSSIVREHYGSSSQSLVRALATYNGLNDENALEIGRKLKLPSADALHQ
jgi:nucleoid-associated protein YgaU